jgi:hypothetical protein
MKNDYLHYRTTKEVKQMLKELATADNRTPSDWINNIIKIEYKKMKGKGDNMKKQFTIIVKGNQCHGYYANVATTYTKWKCSVNIDSTGYVEKVESEFITGLEKSDFTKSLVEKTKEFRDLVDGDNGHYPEWLE